MVPGRGTFRSRHGRLNRPGRIPGMRRGGGESARADAGEHHRYFLACSTWSRGTEVRMGEDADMGNDRLRRLRDTGFVPTSVKAMFHEWVRELETT